MHPGPEQIVVVQLSDLHFGCRRRFGVRWLDGRRPHDRLLCERVQNVLERDVRIDCEMTSDDRLHVLVTGDLTSGGADNEFKLVHEYLHEQNVDPVDGDSYGLGIPKQDIFFASIAGNHDHWGDHCMPGVPAFSPLIYGSGWFEKTVRRVWWSPNSKLKLEIYGVDSASGLAVSRSNYWALGKLSATELKGLELELLQSNTDEPLAAGTSRVRIICCHHSLVYNKGNGPTPGIIDETTHANIIDAGSTAALLQIARDYDVAAVLTGHIHKFWTHKHAVGSRWVWEITCSTTSQAKSGQNGFWVHQISLVNGKPSARSIPYSWNPTDHDFERRESGPLLESGIVEPYEWL